MATQLETLFKQYDIYITYLDFRSPVFRCHFVIPRLEISCAVEGRSLRQLQNRMVEIIEENLKSSVSTQSSTRVGKI